MKLDAIGRLSLTHLPTPLEALPRFASELGLSRLLVKRDDLTSLALGGNKARKLEYELFPCVEGGFDTVLTIGGTQSNHARMTAAAARKLGLEPKLVLGGPDFAALHGNMLLNAMFGAEVRYLLDDDENDHLAAAMEAWAEELAAAGRKPFTLPIGGSTGRGVLGYVKAMRELSEQIDDPELQIVVGVGSCGTVAGTILGARLFLPKSRVVGISVSRKTPAIQERTLQLTEEACSLIDSREHFDLADVEAYDGYVDSYGVATPGGLDAIRRVARTEGLLLDPVYTGKVMAGLIDLVEIGKLDRKRPVVFVHTGGTPITFAYENDLSSGALFKKVRQS
jgi:L-cysteate sulfo-lyase